MLIYAITLIIIFSTGIAVAMILKSIEDVTTPNNIANSDMSSSKSSSSSAATAAGLLQQQFGHCHRIHIDRDA